jgi:hypothetical protein
MPTPSKNLRDPETFGEDLFAIANRAAELSQVHCKGCGGYHWRVPARRAVGLPESLSSDRMEIVSKIQEFSKQHFRTYRHLEIIIAGAADTGLLATAAHAVATANVGERNDTHYTIIDQCQTPLQLCLEFSAMHGLDCSIIQDNLVAAMPPKPADIILMHSVLRFFSASERIQLLRRATHWIAPHGRLLISNTYGIQSTIQRSARVARKEESSRRIEQAVIQGLLQAPVPLGDLRGMLETLAGASLDRERVFKDAVDLEHLAKATGWEVQQLALTNLPDSPTANELTQRLLAVLVPMAAET